MKKGASYLRYAAAAVFLAAAAWTLAFFIGREQSPETVRAERTEVGISIVAEGTVWRKETVVICDDAGAYLAHRSGDRVSGGSVIAVKKSVLDDYLTHLELSGGAQPDRGEMRGLTYAPEAGIFSTFLDGRESFSIEDVSSAEPFIPQGAVGKIVSGGWYFIAETPEADRFRRGQSVTVSLPDEVSATVISAENGKIVLRCRDGLEDVVNTRFAALRITVAEAQGIKIPDEALHRDGEGTFVNVMRAGLAERCDVDILHTGEGYVLVREGEIRENMQIILDSTIG